MAHGTGTQESTRQGCGWHGMQERKKGVGLCKVGALVKREGGPWMEKQERNWHLGVAKSAVKWLLSSCSDVGQAPVSAASG